MNRKGLKAIPKFKDEDEEAEFWATHDSTDYFDTKRTIVNPTFPSLKPSTRSITMRVSESMLYDLKMLANRMDVPYQSLAKMLLDEKIREEMKASK
ncbi:MAG: BrnA antitoxin family protein [Chloroflexi bacterium]|nr:BrnA antitoxin family protein [Chloroflexota bacterium]